MWKDNLDVERFEESLDRMFVLAVTEVADDSFFDFESKSLKPLYRIELNDKEVKATFDLPHVERITDVEIDVTEDALRMEAKTAAPVKLQVRGGGYAGVEFEKFTIRVQLPAKVDPEKATAKLVKGLLVVRLPIAHHGMPIKLE